MVEHNGGQQAAQLSQALKQLGINVDVVYESRKVSGGKFVFREAGSQTNLNAQELGQRFDAGAASLSPAKQAWLNSLGSYIDPRTAAIGGGKVEDAGFLKVVNDAAVLNKLQPVIWDLQSQGIGTTTAKGHENLTGVARALTNISQQIGDETLRFQVDAAGKLTYSSTRLTGTALDDAAKQVLETVLVQDLSLTAGGKLGTTGQQLLSAITSKPGQLALDKATTGIEPEGIVNLIENKNILLALGKNVPVRVENGAEVYGKAEAAKSNSTIKSPVKVNANIPGFGQAKNVFNQAKNAIQQGQAAQEAGDPFAQINHGGMKEADIIKALPMVVVEDNSAPLATPSGGGKPAPKGKGR